MNFILDVGLDMKVIFVICVFDILDVCMVYVWSFGSVIVGRVGEDFFVIKVMIILYSN